MADIATPPNTGLTAADGTAGLGARSPSALSPLTGRYGGGPGVTLSPLGPRVRISLRAGEPQLGAIEDALGLELPMRPKGVAQAGSLAALWLGPDEWLLIDESGEDAPTDTGAALMQRLSSLEDQTFSAVNVSNRNVGFAVDGRAAEAVLMAGCPQDLRLASFPTGTASRTVVGKAEIVLWRRTETRFEVECWRSFADYLWTFMSEAARAPAV
ncbi:sarcosine oxidase subunit gamma [Mangrovicella endophytica]|uniref:sarcosine oxidase subunit gamma n=1 Tax=Mangrovicella endophytica TaxID=2066697 RepID=UPI000C9E4199|nr:sarcosine oxidase subunit gamma [Mangrovicella endophytica]